MRDIAFEIEKSGILIKLAVTNERVDKIGFKGSVKKFGAKIWHT